MFLRKIGNNKIGVLKNTPIYKKIKKTLDYFLKWWYNITNCLYNYL